MDPIPAHTDLPKQYDVYPFIDLSNFTGKLKGKVVCITGASAGIGRTTCLAFAHAGASLACVARRKDRLDALVDEIKQKYNLPVVAIPADLSDPKAPKQIIQDTESALGPIDILINNAGLLRVRRFEDVENLDEWWQMVEINFRAPMALTHAVLPSMIARKTGILLNVCSSVGVYDANWMSGYGASKIGTMKLYQHLATELARHGITTFNAHPGMVMTDMVQYGFGEVVKHYSDELPPDGSLKWQTPELAANTFLALCADERCKKLSGRYIDAEQDLEKVVEAAESGRVEKERLYRIRIDEI